MRHLIVGTAGHIDHGKSSLVRALTGIDPDRLQEEKDRGITIDLGFADLELDPERVISFVDVPGHERFVRHMVAGATGIDSVLLVVACDDGVRPQTREHLAICSLLRIRHGIVALSKSDLADGEMREVVELELREFLKGSFLEGAAVVPVSARTGEGLPELREALLALFDRVPERPAGGVARLPVDRSFVLRGFGTVVTGTLASGSLREGNEVEVLPGGRRGRIRGLQVHRRKVAEVRAGQRVAVNLQGLDRAEAPRGATVCIPNTLPLTRRIWARIELLASAPEAVRKGGPIRFHHGTSERSGRLRIIEEPAEGEVLCEIRFGQDTVLLPGDPFILRRPAPVDTVGGGVVLDVRPPATRGRARPSMPSGARDADEAILQKLEQAGAAGREAVELAAELGLAPADLEERATGLERSGRLVRAMSVFVHAAAWEALEAASATALAMFHAKEPLRFGMSREELRSRLCRTMTPEAWRFFLERLQARGVVRLDAQRVADARHTVRLAGADAETARRIEARFRDAGLDPPDAAQLVQFEGGTRVERILDILLESGSLVRIRDGRLFHAHALETLRSKLRDYARTCTSIDVATFKQIAGVTRKNAIPLLEHLDAERTTRRVGNLREILTK